MNKYYCGVGSRETPNNILSDMEKIAYWMARRGWTLRSGRAYGADTFFEKGCDRHHGYKEIFIANDALNDTEAMEIAKSLHPAWYKCSPYARLLHTRNMYQVLGKDLKTPVKCVICWTPDGCTCHKDKTIKTGGTGMAISIASTNGIPVFNLQRKDHYKRVMDVINEWRNNAN